ncbi:hypothetical protein EGJ51_19675 [Pseudomonas fulva]|nr:hypothetical protein EGJ51_19675 [Pseudomonas fulva]
MVSVPREPSAQMLDAARSAPIPMVHVDSMRARQDLEFSARYKAAISQCTQPAPQPHPEPIAWMVGTAFWWTKEEAERDAAETGLPIDGLGPMACAAPADQHQSEPTKVRVGSGQFNDDDRYLLCREELRECEDERSALSDEAREHRDRAANLDALLAEALLAIEGGCHAVSLPERISAALSRDDEQDPPSGYFFDTGPYQVELGEEQWLKALSVFDNYTQGNQDTFACPGDNLRGLVSEILIELGLAPSVD